jgi:large-conductance mechanosensitive channel
MSLIAEFKQFAMKGNVLDMAVGVVIGAAFGKIVSSLVGDVITPFSSALGSQAAVVTMADMSTLEVEADVSEGNIAKVKVGQPAEVTFDAYPGLTLKGHVASIGAGTGSEFSVLPAQNANGNWIGYGEFIQALVDFLIIAAAIFMALKAINRLKAPAPAAAPPPAADVVLLTEIRDLLRQR